MTKRIQQIIRLAETNLDGSKPVSVAIRSIKGISFMLSNAIVKSLGLEGKKLHELSEEEQKKLEDVIFNLKKINIPSWMFNRKRDPETGEDLHLVASKLEFTQKMDINLMKKLKTYKGVRHAAGLPVRGQRTRSSFRKKGKTVGVMKKSRQQQSGKK
jgi:small subunit ribosomal protein S13